MAKRAPGVRVVAVDANADAVELLRFNVARNDVASSVTVRVADGFGTAKEGAPWDRIVVNLPHGSADDLASALESLRPGGVLHATRVLEEASADEWIAGFASDHSARVLYVGQVHPYSPSAALYAFDLARGPET
jgi:tRNA G37 N-methylase Trm5